MMQHTLQDEENSYKREAGNVFEITDIIILQKFYTYREQVGVISPTGPVSQLSHLYLTICTGLKALTLIPILSFHLAEDLI